MRIILVSADRRVPKNKNCRYFRWWFWFPIRALPLAMRKTDSVMIFLMCFTLTLYRYFHVRSDKSLGRRTPHKSRWLTGGVLLCVIRFSHCPRADQEPETCKALKKKKRPQKCGRSLICRAHFDRVYKDILVYAGNPRSRTSAPSVKRDVNPESLQCKFSLSI